MSNFADLGITREAPGPDGRGRAGNGRYDAITEALKKEPGTCFKIAANRRSTSVYLAARKRGMEATTRRNPDGTFDFYARWPESS